MKKNLMNLAMAAMLAVSVVGCSKVPSGNVGIKVNLLGSEKGVDVQELTPGRYYIGMNEELYLFPTFTQTDAWRLVPNGVDESISFQTSQGLTVSADVGISYAIDPTKANLLFQKYRKGIDEISDIYLRSLVRDSLVKRAGDLDIESVYGKGKGELIEAVEKDVRNAVMPIGINVERIYWLGNLRLPQTVVNSINAKIEATQKAQQRENEVQTAEAQANIKRAEAQGDADAITIRSKAEAESNRIVSNSLTPTLVEYKKNDKWNGELPTVTGGSIPMINLTSFR